MLGARGKVRVSQQQRRMDTRPTSWHPEAASGRTVGPSAKKTVILPTEQYGEFRVVVIPPANRGGPRCKCPKGRAGRDQQAASTAEVWTGAKAAITGRARAAHRGRRAPTRARTQESGERARPTPRAQPVCAQRAIACVGRKMGPTNIKDCRVGAGERSFRRQPAPFQEVQGARPPPRCA